MTFRIRGDDPKCADLVEDAVLYYEGMKFYIVKVIKERDEEQAWHTVLCEAAFMRLADIIRVGSLKVESMTAHDGLNFILDGTGWISSPGTSTTDATLYSMEGQDASVLDLVWQWAKVTGNELQFGVYNSEIGIGPFVGSDTGLSFRYGRNLTKIKRTATPPRVTRLYAFGRNDLDIKSLSGGVPYLEDYSFYTATGMTEDAARAAYRKDQIYKDDSFIDAQALYDAAQVRLAYLAQPSILYEADVVDLTTLVNSPLYQFENGDIVRVYDEVLGINVAARVSRKVWRPADPTKNKIELSFNPIELPDPNISTARRDSTQSWELFESRNRIAERRVRQSSTILHRIKLETIEDAEWVVGFKLQGTAVGSCNITVSCVDDEIAENIWSPFTQAVVDGEEIDFHFTYGAKEIPAGTYTLVIRAYSDSAGEGFNVLAGDTAFWVLARGTTRQNPTLTNSVRYDYTGAVQTFTVPDDVTEILVEAHGAAGGTIGAPNNVGGNGGMVTASFVVVAGDTYDVYVGGQPGSTSGGWPDGGDGDSNGSGSAGRGGGGSTQLRPEAGALSTSLVVAAGGGGTGSGTLGPDVSGGYGGFLLGGDGTGQAVPVATGATQDLPGEGGHDIDFGPGPFSQLGEDGDTDGVGQGGDAADTSNNFAFPGGGGGGGWHGGGGAGRAGAAGFYAGGGAGGSGWADGAAFDLDVSDDDNDENGFMIISWETPEV